MKANEGFVLSTTNAIFVRRSFAVFSDSMFFMISLKCPKSGIMDSVTFRPVEKNRPNLT